ncbi:MAG: ATP-binding protein [Candidatus Eisenbacteria sp.]|nr:ATP-binding protein [Candidatus Eisenbacteria bacterium]
MSEEQASRRKVVRLTFPAEFEFLALLNVAVEETLRAAGADEEIANAVANAVMEAGTNAVQYGRPESEVEIEFHLGVGEIEIVVSDRGPGFDPERVSDLEEAAGSMALRGRGISIMKALMDEVIFEPREDGGTSVRMSKNLHL